MQRGEKASSGLFCEFCGAVKKAEADAEVRMVALWQKQIPENWQAARDFLARRFPERWSGVDRHRHEGSIGTALEIYEVVVPPPVVALPDNHRDPLPPG